MVDINTINSLKGEWEGLYGRQEEILSLFSKLVDKRYMIGGVQQPGGLFQKKTGGFLPSSSLTAGASRSDLSNDWSNESNSLNGTSKFPQSVQGVSNDINNNIYSHTTPANSNTVHADRFGHYSSNSSNNNNRNIGGNNANGIASNRINNSNNSDKRT
eukprot:TRINITY_DN15289_c0_g1_i1.p1 TRINITY_DN15289_c0_g1~~TRINITY_DN15289_c0_g1_i1.p1  ORF type:complete len:158 (-),score=39.10 TRINITY_DN15289_c0_g1_i1:40-513(-)